MKKIVFPFVEIEVPDDCPSGLDPEAVFEYMGKHPEVANKVVREYRKAYHKWINSKDDTYAPTASEQQQTTTRSEEVSVPVGSRKITGRPPL